MEFIYLVVYKIAIVWIGINWLRIRTNG